MAIFRAARAQPRRVSGATSLRQQRNLAAQRPNLAASAAQLRARQRAKPRRAAAQLRRVSGKTSPRVSAQLRREAAKPHSSVAVPLRTAMKADCGTLTCPNSFMRFLPSFCFLSTFCLRVTSPP